ncbi:protein containing Clp, N-terminal domain [sediment metagenome]|uniref:Protein containing Clp, N-terminal domain n=1 Tax=sediment metagenome TaxID=749907 RepID=D9PJD0_9ZZZZ
MYERFSDRAKKALQLANQEACRFNHEFIDPEHVLLGLIREGSGIAASVLKEMDVDLRKIRSEVGKSLKEGSNLVTMGKLPLTPRAKKHIEYSMEEAKGLHHNYVGTEHILLGLLREEEGVAAKVLTDLGLSYDKVKQKVLTLLGQNTEDYSYTENLEDLADNKSQQDKSGPEYWVVYRHIMDLTAFLDISHRLNKKDGEIKDEQGYLLGYLKDASSNPVAGVNVAIIYQPENVDQVRRALSFREYLDKNFIIYSENPKREEVAAEINEVSKSLSQLVNRLRREV